MSVDKKSLVREYITERCRNKKPVPDMKEIRRQLGWELKELSFEEKENSEYMRWCRVNCLG